MLSSTQHTPVTHISKHFIIVHNVAYKKKSDLQSICLFLTSKALALHIKTAPKYNNIVFSKKKGTSQTPSF
jgi:hypothetical protein